VGKAGDPLPEFEDHMIRLLVDKEGKLHPMEPAEEIRACNFPKEKIGYPKEAAVKGWFQYKAKADKKYASELEKVRRQRKKEATVGYMRWPGDEAPPPSALAGRIVIGQEVEAERERGRLGKGLMGGIFGRSYQEGPQSISGQLKSKNEAFR
jgi:hypothetical protein